MPVDFILVLVGGGDLIGKGKCRDLCCQGVLEQVWRRTVDNFYRDICSVKGSANTFSRVDQL